RSIREYQNKHLTKETLSCLLWASTGISRKEGAYEFRTSPSAGALYPIETYLVVNNVKEVESGLYHYNIQNHYLELLKKGDYAVETAKAALNQKMCVQAPVVFIWTAVFERMKWKYGQRAYRYVYLDAGHIAENLALTATSLKLGSCQIGALFDDEVNKIIDVDGTAESVIYMSVVG
ncbi:MAG: SagB/ThcOx family dehydrogenase, partial [Deltaproteobacteria bacterium]|nr:SagB/ThcOx family dehydrogenase [Deltaproteobacteria bacterium]